MADDHRGFPVPDREVEFLITSPCRLTCGYDAETLCWRHVVTRYDVA